MLIPAIERAAGLDHYHNYRGWMTDGGIDGFLERNSPGKLSLIAPHFNGCIKIMVVSKVKKDPLAASLKRQQNTEETATEKGMTT